MGLADDCVYGGVLCGCPLVCKRVRAAEVNAMSTVTVVMLVLTILLIGYLVFALLYPEKF